VSTEGSCGSGHCITCSDEAVPMRVLQAPRDDLAVCVDEHGQRTEVMTDIVGDVAPGDVVLVHAGAALSVTESLENFR
jgi:hydrogenase maturation factor